MTFFLKSANRFKLSSKEFIDLHERLPVGTYSIGFDTCSGQFYLEQIENFEVKGKLYGSTQRHADRILRTFLDRSASTGVLLAGEKGSGKTLLAKYISVLAAARHQIPTIVVNRDWSGEQFSLFLQKIEQPTVMLFDEYEKVYGICEQEKMLTLLDGVYPSKKLFVLTSNDRFAVNENMRNRPGRIFYSLNFCGLDCDFIREYCEDHLKAKEHIGKVCAISSLFDAFNFDMLKGLVEEMNRYSETPAEALQFLNVRPDFAGERSFDVKMELQGKELTNDEHGIDQKWAGNPLQRMMSFRYYEKKEGGGVDRKELKFSAAQLEQIDPPSGTHVFINESEGARLTLTPTRETVAFDFDALDSKLATTTPAADGTVEPPAAVNGESSIAHPVNIEAYGDY